MTSKTQAIISGWVMGISGFVTWLVSLPPESQDGVIKPLIELTPLHWRPTIGLITRALATASGIYGLYRASHSGPQSPPVDKPTE